MYKLLVVDDEMWIRKGIISRLQNTGYHFSSILEAENGEVALEVVRKEKPDIVLTDVKMPFMDGIQLIKAVKESFPGIRFIVVSGYADFQYAKEALSLGVSEYVLKPINEENLGDALHKAMASLEEQTDILRMKSSKERLEKEFDGLNLEQFLNGIFHYHIHTDPEDLNSSPLPDTFKSGACYVLVGIHIDSVSFKTSRFQESDLELVKFALRNIMSELTGKAQCSSAVLNNLKEGNQILLLLANADREMLKAEADRIAVDFRANVEKYLDLSVTAAVGGVEDRLGSELYRHMKAALDLRLIHGGNRVYRYEEVSRKSAGSLQDHKIKLLEKYMELGDFQQISATINSIFETDNLKEFSGIHIHVLCNIIINLLVKKCINGDADILELYDVNNVTSQILSRFEDASEIAGHLNSVISNVLEKSSSRINDCGDIVDRIKEQIDLNYQEEISVNNLARKFGVNANYFSTIFRKKVGMTVTEYHQNVRIGKACSLLRETQATNSDIARSVGYADTLYFYRVFKKITGMTPVEFRSRNQ